MATPVVPSNTARVQLIDEFGVVYKATGGGSSVEIQVEGVDNASQTLVNFVSGTPANLTITNPSGGIVQLDVTAAGTGDVVGPASAVANDIAVFSGTTGKLIADGGTTIAAINSSIAGKLSAVTADSPLSGSGTSGSHLVIADAAADGTTKGAAAFTANDFNAAAGVISIDYTNGQAADATHKGFLTSADWSAFNGKQASGNYITALTGDVTASGPGSVAATLANIPNATPMAGDLLATAIAAPATPAAGKGAVYVDSTSKNLAVKDDAGVVKHGVQTQASASNTFLTAISDAGAVSTGTAVTSINKTGSTALVGAVTLTGGSNVTLTQSGQDISIASTGGGTSNKVGCRAYSSTTITLNTSGLAALGFDTERWDNGATHNTVTNNSRFVATTAGVYAITFNYRTSSFTQAQGPADFYMVLNGDTTNNVIGARREGSNSTGDVFFWITGDYV